MDAFARTIDAARDVVGCVTETPLVVRPLRYHDRAGIGLALPQPGRLRASGLLRQSTVRVELTLRSDGPEAGVLVDRYGYALFDRNGTELLTWHFHPESAFSDIAFPHLHVSATLRPATADGERGVIPLDKIHLPTGMVALAAFVRMLIEEFGVEPLARDWRERLAEA